MKNLYSLIFALFISTTIWAQTPQKMSYQAVIRNTSNTLITSSPIGMQISILQGSATGSVVYAETQTTNTNANGLVSIEIGNGTVVTGTFSTINWANGPYFIKTETDPTGGAAYTISGTSELLSVPYALHAKTAESISGGITETDPVFGASAASAITSTDVVNWNNKLSSETDPFFAASVASTITSTDVTNWNNKLSTEVDGSVTNELQTLSISNDTIYLSNGGYTKLPAGFNGDYNSLTNKPTTISSFSNDAGYLTSFTEVDGSITNELQTLRVSNDTIYLSNGGFAKLPSINAWSLNGNTGTVDGTNFIGTTDNVPLNFKVNNQPAGKINFTLGNTSLGYHSYPTTTPDAHNSAFGAFSLEGSSGAYNTAIGSYAYRYNTNGNYNTILGSQAGQNNTSGSRNVFIGYAAGYNEMGSNKLYIANDFTNPPLIYGDFATANIGLGTITPTFKLEVTADVSFNGVRVGRGNGNVSNNTAVGFSTLNSNTSGANNTVVGFKALELNTSGGQNTAMGDNALAHNTTATGNTSIGYATLAENTTGNFNSAMGYDALLYNTTGEHNTALGAWAMHFNTIGKWNTALGFSSLQKNISGNNNTSIGQEAGFNNTLGNGNVFLGYQAGYNETGSNKLYIANSNTTTPLIYGDFTSGNVGIGTTVPTAKLEIQGAMKIVDGTQEAGKVLTSDATGLATWQSLTTYSAGNGISITGNMIATKDAFYLGQDTLGGIVYYIYKGSDGHQHGLIVSKTETVTIWGANGTNNAIKTSDGAYNTGFMPSGDARAWVESFGASWYLPSIDELAILWNNRFHVNNSTASGLTQLKLMGNYWSSTENDSDYSIFFYFFHGYANAGTKNSALNVRAIKSF